MERKLCGIRKLEKITNKEIRKKTEGKIQGETIIKLEWRYAGHIAKDKKNKWGTKILNWRPFGGSRERSRSATRWRDEIVKEKGIIWHRETWNRRSWEEARKRIPKNGQLNVVCWYMQNTVINK